MNPEKIKCKSDLHVYLLQYAEEFAHIPLAVGVRPSAYNQIVRDLHANPNDAGMSIYFNGVMIVPVPV